MIDKIDALEQSQLTTQKNSEDQKVNWLKRKLKGWIASMPELENSASATEYLWRLG